MIVVWQSRRAPNRVRWPTLCDITLNVRTKITDFRGTEDGVRRSRSRFRFTFFFHCHHIFESIADSTDLLDVKNPYVFFLQIFHILIYVNEILVAL